MKRLMSIVILCLLMISCSSKNEVIELMYDENTWMFSAEVKEINNDSLLVEVIYGSYLKEVLVKNNTKNENTSHIFCPETNTIHDFPADLKIGDNIIVFYDGVVTKSLPPQITSSNLIWKLNENNPFDFKDWKPLNNN